MREDREWRHPRSSPADQVQVPAAGPRRRRWMLGRLQHGIRTVILRSAHLTPALGHLDEASYVEMGFVGERGLFYD